MNSYLTLIGSFLIGGLLLISINRYSSTVKANYFNRSLDSITLHSGSEISKLIEYDLNQMGLRVSRYTESLILADSNRITFYGDVNSDGAADSVRYFLGDSTTASSTENPHDKILYRVVNNEAETDVTLGVTNFKVRYFDSVGNESNTLTQIKTFEITLDVESTIPYDNQYSKFHWQTRISPPNLLRY